MGGLCCSMQPSDFLKEEYNFKFFENSDMQASLPFYVKCCSSKKEAVAKFLDCFLFDFLARL